MAVVIMMTIVMTEMNMMKRDFQRTNQVLLTKIESKDDSIYSQEVKLSSLKNPSQTFACAGNYATVHHPPGHLLLKPPLLLLQCCWSWPKHH